MYEKSGSIIKVKKERNILHIPKGIKINWFDHIFRRNCSLKHVTEGKIERKWSVVRRRIQLLEDLKEKNYWNLKYDAQDRILWRTGFEKLWTCRQREQETNDFDFT
jgi:hypothetical protein